MLGFMKKILGSDRKIDTPSPTPDESRTEQFYIKLAEYVQPLIGEEATLKMLANLEGTCLIVRTPESLGVPNRGRTWEAFIDSESGTFNRVVVFLDAAPINMVVKNFYHDALPVIEKNTRART